MSWAERGYIQDPTDSDYMVEWTEDKWHKIHGQFRFHAGSSYQTVDKRNSHGGIIWGVTVPDLSSIVLEPRFEFAFEVWTSNVVSGGIVNQRGEHPMVLLAEIYTPDEYAQKVVSRVTPLARFKNAQMRGPSFRETFPSGIRIQPDSGRYIIEWSIARSENDGTRDRQGTGGVTGHFEFDSSCDDLRRRLRINHNI